MFQRAQLWAAKSIQIEDLKLKASEFRIEKKSWKHCGFH
jgi:hypothetical protein